MGKQFSRTVRCGVEKYGTRSSEKTIAILGDRWWPRTVKQEGNKINAPLLCNMWKTRMMWNAHMLEASQLGVGTVLRLQRDAWSMIK